MSMSFYITTAIDYVNSRPHLGTAYEKITADVIARYKRLTGVPTWFLMGNDEHSLNVFRRAKEQGLDPKAYCDRMEREFREVWQRLDVSFDDFIRTTEDRHRVSVTELVTRIQAAGDIYEGHYEGWYCDSCEAFKQEKDLVDGLCPNHKKQARVDPREELLLPPVEVPGAAAAPLRGASGVPRARRAAQRDRERDPGRARGHLDQPRGAGLGHSAAVRSAERGLRLVRRAHQLHLGPRLRQDDTPGSSSGGPRRLHVIGKDITRFHCVIWPAMLMSAGLPLADARVRPRLRVFQGREDEQVARARSSTRSRRRRSSGPTRCASTSSASSRTARTATSRGNGSRSATTRTSPTTSATSSAASRRWPTSTAAGRLRAACGDAGPAGGRGGEGGRRVPRGDGHVRAAGRHRRGLRARGRHEPVHHRDRAVETGEGPGQRRPGRADRSTRWPRPCASPPSCCCR